MSEAEHVLLLGADVNLPTMRATPGALRSLALASEVRVTAAQRMHGATHAGGTDSDRRGRAALIFAAGIAANTEKNVRLQARPKAEA